MKKRLYPAIRIRPRPETTPRGLRSLLAALKELRHQFPNKVKAKWHYRVVKVKVPKIGDRIISFDRLVRLYDDGGIEMIIDAIVQTLDKKAKGDKKYSKRML